MLQDLSACSCLGCCLPSEPWSVATCSHHLCPLHLSVGGWKRYSFLSARQYISPDDGGLGKILIRVEAAVQDPIKIIIIMPIVSEDLTVNQEFQACSSTSLLETAVCKWPFSQISYMEAKGKWETANWSFSCWSLFLSLRLKIFTSTESWYLWLKLGVGWGCCLNSS